MTTSNIDTLFGKMGFLKQTSIAQLEKVTPFTRQQIHNMMHTLVNEKAVERRKGPHRMSWYTRIKKTRKEQRVHRGSGEKRAGVKKKNEWDVDPVPPHTGSKGAKERVVDNLNGKHAETDTQLQKAFREAVTTEPAPVKPKEKEVTKEEVLAACETILDNIAIVDTFVRKTVAAAERIVELEKANAEQAERLAKIERDIRKLLPPTAALPKGIVG